MARDGVVHGQRIDWRRRHVLYLAVVPLDGAAARGAGTRAVAFAMLGPDF